MTLTLTSTSAMLARLDRRLTQALQSISVGVCLIYFSMWLHHHYVTPHVKAPTLDIPGQFTIPLCRLSRSRFYTVETCLLFALSIFQFAQGYTRASPFCHWVGFDKVCVATEVRYRLGQAYIAVVGIMVVARFVDEIVTDLLARRNKEENDAKSKTTEAAVPK
ncbi:hypothetical protein JCM16303_006717 [Sporobolomyces ruberrimus]